MRGARSGVVRVKEATVGKQGVGNGQELSAKSDVSFIFADTTSERPKPRTKRPGIFALSTTPSTLIQDTFEMSVATGGMSGLFFPALSLQPGERPAQEANCSPL